MYPNRALGSGFRQGSRRAHALRRGLATTSERDVAEARKYCLNQLRRGDYEAYLVRHFIPRSAQDAYDALRTLNLELARLPETVSNPAIGRFRMQFWRDTVTSTFAGHPPREPISILLHSAVTSLAARAGSGSASSVKFWLLRLIDTREKHMENKPFPSLAALEDYAENTYATLMYMTLAMMPLRSVHMDHLASHIGKACGIVATLRGIPVLAGPSQPVQGPLGSSVGNTRSPALLLPLDIMTECGLKEEDVFRRGPHAEGLQDAVFRVATRANDHLITAREMLKNMQLGGGPGHHYEHQGEPEHAYSNTPHSPEGTQGDIQRGFGVLLEAVAAGDYLQRLEGVNFDPFKVRSSWKLPWGLWKALRRHEI
ncbi:NADH dehydrogenase complex I, assembly factor 6 [Achaetomium macrosporum]|uniref:NADH dehydrogenase complex I, assembly factor 6 n=1 Tax=Achaetomium macrosporum TaxID=79813 RepID=A0AAN7C1D8_9PEZI|nr:NADH dehydrogenase complex I, assembly factor 6 [Achaetomium macrosporum]